MAVLLYSGKLLRNLLLVQLMTFVLSSLLFGTLGGVAWGVAAFAGGCAVWLPNLFFMPFLGRNLGGHAASGKMAWKLAFGEAAKVVSTVVLLIVVLGGFKAAFWPVVITFFLMLVTQILASIWLNRHHN